MRSGFQKMMQRVQVCSVQIMCCWALFYQWQVGGAAVALDPALAEFKAEIRNKGWIVFSSKTEGDDWDLAIMRPDGSDRRRMTNTREYSEAGGRFSPDGTRLLYYRVPKSEAVDNNTYGTFDLVIASADGSEPEIWGNSYQWASWGTDGRTIACLSPKGIQIVDLKTHKVVRELARKGIVEQLVWSPDGKWFVGTANGLGQFWNIGLVHGTTGEVRALSETERYNCTPDWAPDSQHVVYARGIIPEKGGHAELWIASINGKERFRAYAEPDHHIYGACVSPDGKYLLFTRSVADLGRVNGTTMAIIRCPDLTHPATNSNSGVVMLPRIDLEPGWEPHWTQSAPGAAWNLIILSDGNQNHHESSSSAR